MHSTSSKKTPPKRVKKVTLQLLKSSLLWLKSDESQDQEGAGKNKSNASGGEVCHLENRLRMRFAPRSSGQITSAFKNFIQKEPLRPVC
ncbi:hypothetical protein [Desulfoluna spongiiphila]|uniref:hypothetical protein n=1 Tax=Desulfoluna spongiiphila TaxID=419481 RepID=UPI001587B35C|nr:hypothetical protein [Desulfoluna spongiiphila]